MAEAACERTATMFRIRWGMLLFLTTCLVISGTAAEVKPIQKIKAWGEVLDPDSDCKINETNGKVTIEVPGAYHDLWPGQGKTNAPRILQDAEGDFIVQVKVPGQIRPQAGTVIPGLASSVPFQAATLLIWQDDNNFVRLDRASMVKDNKTIFFCYYHAFKEGKRVVHLSRNFKDQATHLRLERREGKIHAAVSQDGGKTWPSFRPEAIDLPMKLKVGVAALNSTDKPLLAEFEDFKVSKR
jgi:regulation of enolase protein 1 (concanavalin A-like superfamily)